MQTFIVKFLNTKGTYQTVKLTEIDAIHAQLTVIVRYPVQQIVAVKLSR